MKEKEAQLQGEVDELLRRAQEMDEEEDRRYGKDRRGDELPEELAFREGRVGEDTSGHGGAGSRGSGPLRKRLQRKARSIPVFQTTKPSATFTDAQSRIMPGPGGREFLQAYNCQAVVDHEHQVIVATRATDVASDKQQAVVMIEEAIANVGVVPREVSADAGYYSAPAVADLQALGTDPFIAPEKTRHGYKPPPAPRGAGYPRDLSPRGPGCAASCRPNGVGSVTRCAWGQWSRSSAQIKQGRGFRQFLFTGFGEGPRRVVSDLHPATTCSSCSASAGGQTVVVVNPASQPTGCCQISAPSACRRDQFFIATGIRPTITNPQTGC